MTKRTTLAGLAVLGLLAAACSKQAPPQAPSAAVEAPPPAAATPPPAPTYDRAKLARMATGMLALIDEAPQCQAFRDQLQAIVDAPADAPPAAAPSAIVVQANEAGCAKKSGQ